MLSKFYFLLFLISLCSFFSIDVLAKPKRDDDLVVYFSRILRLPEPEGLWAIMSNNVTPTLTKVLFEKCPPGVLGIACAYRNDEIRILNKKKSNQRWVFLNRYMPDYIVGADINGDGRDELVAKYHDGTFLIKNIHTGKPIWTKLLSVGREVEVADLNGNGKADLIMDGPTPGLQARMDNGKWVKITSLPTGSYWAFNLDGKYRDDLVVKLKNKVGLYTKRKNQGFVKIHAQTPLNVWLADTDGDGRDNIVASFGSKFGTLVRQINGKWVKVWAGSPTHVEPADVNGNGRDDLVFYSNLNRINIRLDNGKWLNLWNGMTRILAAGDIDGNGKDDLVVSSLNTSGNNATSTWVWMNNTKWAELATGEALSIFGAKIITCDQFSGICAWVAAPGFSRNTYAFANLDGR